jgi:hypothetical protein
MMACGCAQMAVDPIKRKAGLAAKRASPWRHMPVCTDKGRASSERYRAEDERREAERKNRGQQDEH